MKKNILIILTALLPLFHIQGQTAKSVLDKTASIVGRKGGASASFSITSDKLGTSKGVISIKGNKFKATTSDAVVWFNGKTQWTYMPATDEINVTTPTKEQQTALNPYSFINLYKEGYDSSLQAKGSNYVVTLKAKDSKRNIRQMIITIGKNNYVPSKVKMLQGGAWTTISISNFKATNQPDALFSFNKKDYPDAEIIDLR